MAWNMRRRWNYRDEEYCAFRNRQDRTSERGTKYRRDPNHQKKCLSENEKQKREWKNRKSQYRDRIRNWTSYKHFVKFYCARYYRTWVRTNLACENWEAFVGSNQEYKHQENPWSWD